MRKLREWMNRKKRAKHFKMYQLEPVSNVIPGFSQTYR